MAVAIAEPPPRVALTPPLFVRSGAATEPARPVPRPADVPAPPTRPAGSLQPFTIDAPDGTAAVAARDRAYTLAVAGADVVGLAVALGIASLVGASLGVGSVLLAVLVIVTAGGAGLYDRDELMLRNTTLEEAPRLFAMGGLITLVAILGESLVFSEPPTSVQALVLWVALTLAMLVSRTAARAVVQSQVAAERCLLIGSIADERRLEQAFGGESAASPMAGRVPLERVMQLNDRGDCEVNVRALAGLVRYFGAQRLIISAEHATPNSTLELLRASKAVGVRLSFLSIVLGAIGHGLVVDDVYGVPLVGVRRFRLRRRERMIKRASDIVGAGLLLLLFALLLLVLAVLVRVDSAGPIFFRQRRIGRDGRAFDIRKFRTMCADAEARKEDLRRVNEASGLFKIADDPRITRIGRFLRRTSLDELPQLLNVLRGDMRLVGPRPLVPDEDEQIRGYDRRRLHLTPGMTGHWQILGSARVSLEEMLRIDYRYVTGWTLWGDVKILLRTVPYVVARRGL